MNDYIFPHTTNYSSDVSYLIDLYKKLVKEVERLEVDILAESKKYTDEQIIGFQQTVNALIQQLQNDYIRFAAKINGDINVMQSKIDQQTDELRAGLDSIDAATDLKIQLNNEYILDVIASELVDIKVINYFTGEKTTIQDMLDYLAILHATGAITFDELAANNITVNTVIAKNATITDIIKDGKTILVA